MADGYGNRRVAVFDADSGKFKRMWGAFGNKPVDGPLTAPPNAPPEGPPQCAIVHAVRVSDDGFVYVAGRPNRRVQVFTLEGKYVTQVILNQQAGGNTTCGLAFSPVTSSSRMVVGRAPLQHSRMAIHEGGKVRPRLRQARQRPRGVALLKDDTLVVADSESGIALPGPKESAEGQANNYRNVGWRQGIRIGSAKDGSLRPLPRTPTQKGWAQTNWGTSTRA